jgi:beta-lactamase regulating signal transducer with metallopeptidase domain
MNSIETVFEWLLAATLRASVLAVAILGIQLVLRRWLPAGWRHALWLPMLAVLVLPVLPEAPFGLFPQEAPAPVAATVAIADSFAEAPGSAESVIASEPAPAPPVLSNTSPGAAAKLNYLAIAWFAGACGVLAAGVIGYRRNLRRIRLHATAPDRMLQAALVEAASEAGLKRAPRALVSPAVASPAVTGLIRPLLLLPAGFPEGFSAAEARLILLHEFTHLKRLDLPLNWLMCVLQALHWFNPLLWFAFARMRADREAACDARVLSIDATDRRAEYGGALLKLQCVTPSRSLSLGFVGIFERGSEIRSRIREISTHRPGRFAWRAAGGAILTLLLIFGVTKGQQADPAAGGKETARESDPVLPINEPAREVILKKLNSIIIPRIEFQDTTVEEAIEFLRLRAAELDSLESDPARKGVNFVIRHPRPAPAKGVAAPPLLIRELKVRNVSLGRAIQYICELANLRYTVDDTAVILAPRNDIGATDRRTAELEKAIATQAAVVEDCRKVLANIVKARGIVYKGQDPNNPQPVDEVKSALQASIELEKLQLESQIQSLLKFSGDQLRVYAAGLEVPNNTFRQLYPKYLEAKQQMANDKTKGLGDDHPSVRAKADQVKTMEHQLSEGMVNLRDTLQAQWEIADNRLKSAKAMKDPSRADAIKRGLDAQDYVDAKRTFESEQEMLRQMKLKLQSEKMKE